MQIIDILDEVSRQYDLDSHSIIGILKRAVREELGLAEVVDRFSDEKLEIFEYFVDKKNNKRLKRVKITQKKLAYVRDRMYRLIVKEIMNLRFSTLKSRLRKDLVIRGEIVSISKNGLNVKTKFGDAFAPLNLLSKNELEKGKYKAGNIFDFHVYKISLKKDRINIILDRVSKELTKHIVQTLLGNDVNILFIQRMFGERIKIYLDKEPSEEEKELVELTFSEKIVFKTSRGV